MKALAYEGKQVILHETALKGVYVLDAGTPVGFGHPAESFLAGKGWSEERWVNREFQMPLEELKLVFKHSMQRFRNSASHQLNF
jgi:hypothetical protein